MKKIYYALASRFFYRRIIRRNLNVFEHGITSDTIKKQEKSANAMLVKARSHARLGLFREKKITH